MYTPVAADVAKLRNTTGAGMMDCKKALTEAEGDFEKAIDILRKKGQKVAANRADRDSSEGAVIARVNEDNTLGVVISLNCETDFVAKDDSFKGFAQAVADAVVAANPADVAALADVASGDTTVEELRKDIIAKLGENITVRRFVRYETADQLVAYMHGAKIGVMVEFKGDAEVARQVAMHIAAARPQCVSADEVDPELVAKERHIYEEQAAQEGKPAEIVAKMVEGRVRKYLAEVTLLGQQFVMNPDVTIEKFLKEKNTTVAAFTAYHVGEGIEKAVVDYAAEVAAAAKI